ncbi:PDDEXK nuclease domain-containing protein [Parasediminibacterium sp. JCM 36343]|uniref:PDDEXK nuclease domain-containing protein n=1 Tax=Parasediminibacterium sp. JCM 36343 TaxID=3374279 RepID=UPI00397A74BE
MNKPNKNTLFQSVKSLIQAAQQQIIRNINTTMLLTYFEIGRMIVEDEQDGKERADYAIGTITQLSTELTNEFGKGYSPDNLERFRKFYLLYQNRISASVMRKFEGAEEKNISATPMRKSTIIQSMIGQSPFPFSLSWTHYIQLMKIPDENERSFYEIEATQNNWSVRELQRQFNSAIYERLALSRDKEGVKELAKKGQIIESPTDALKSHYVLEFLNLKEDNRYTENELETAIINKLEHFMLELGKGFLFEGRQRRFTFEGDSFFVDLVFYNRLLKCFVLFDLKLGKLTHQDIGQMQMYVNYYDRVVKTKDENSTIGIILCKQENKTVIEFTLPENNKTIFAKEYKEVLPSKAELRKQLA